MSDTLTHLMCLECVEYMELNAFEKPVIICKWAPLLSSFCFSPSPFYYIKNHLTCFPVIFLNNPFLGLFQKPFPIITIVIVIIIHFVFTVEKTLSPRFCIPFTIVISFDLVRFVCFFVFLFFRKQLNLVDPRHGTSLHSIHAIPTLRQPQGSSSSTSQHLFHKAGQRRWKRLQRGVLSPGARHQHTCNLKGAGALKPNDKRLWRSSLRLFSADAYTESWLYLNNKKPWRWLTFEQTNREDTGKKFFASPSDFES